MTGLEEIPGVRWLQDAFPPDLWKGAVLGAIVSAVFAAAWALLRRSSKLRPIRRLMDGFANRGEEVAIFVERLQSQNKYYSFDIPDFAPPRTTGQKGQKQNIPHVVANVDMQAASDFLYLLGSVGKRDNITFPSIPEDWNRWSMHQVSIGGNFKSEQILAAKPQPLVVLHNQSQFKFHDRAQAFGPTRYDAGIICRIKHPTTKKKCMVIMGLGVLGTEAAGHYLRTHAVDLGKMFGREDFAILVRARIDQGKEWATPRWYSPEVPRRNRILHPVVWFRRYRSIRRGQDAV